MPRKPPLRTATPPRAEHSVFNRRRFVSALTGATVASLLLDRQAPFASAASKTAKCTPPRKLKVAIIATKVVKYSHAQHFIDRFLEGYSWQGRHHHPPMQLAGLYVDQFPANDLARERSRRHGVQIYPSIAEALTLGGSKLAVDGVLLIGEHGDYPKNELGQTLYPRHRFFKEIVKVFEASGRAAPVFNDKHLSTDWRECVEMVEDSRRLGFPFLAGSSLPVTWRVPSLELPVGLDLAESVCVCYGGVDSYDFHGYETAQCMSERRAGGEVGVRSVHAVRGDQVWQLLAGRESTTRLLFAALARSFTVKPPAGYTCVPPSLDRLRASSPAAIGCFIEHRDGFRTTMFLLNGLVQDFTYAGLEKATGRIHSCQMYLPMPPRVTTLADFFNPLVNHVEQMILEGRAPYPIERTLLTSGMTLAGATSLHRGQVPVATPEMNVAYQPPAQSTYWRT